MTLNPESLTTRAGRRLLAPRWHTAGLVGILLLTLGVGALLQRRAGPGPGIAPSHRGAIGVYLTALALDWALFYYVWGIASNYGTTLGQIVGGRWRSAGDVLRDAAIAVPFWVVWHLTAVLVHRLFGPNTAKSVDVLLPERTAEIAVWIAVCLTAGFCEEAVFRGYLQQQLRALTGSATVAVAGQAVCFGIAHGYQGFQNVVVITVLGALYGVLALWRRSTRPGMLAHAWADVYGGLRMEFLTRWIPI
jgi:membrane protease YdiL (CAAX protease family)